jgi:hypothetical protein
MKRKEKKGKNPKDPMQNLPPIPPASSPGDTALQYLVRELLQGQARLEGRLQSLESKVDAQSLETRGARIATERVANDYLEVKEILFSVRRRTRKLERFAEAVSDEDNGIHIPFRKEDTPRQGVRDPEASGSWSAEEASRMRELAENRVRLEQLQKQVETQQARRDSSIVWWTRQRWIWTMAIVGAILGVGCTSVNGYVLWRVTQLSGAHGRP